LHLKRLARQGGGRFLDRRGNGWLREDLFDVPRLPLVLRREKRAQPLGLFWRGVLFPRGERAQARALLARGWKLLLDLVKQIGERKLWILVVDGAQRGGRRIVLRIFLGRWRLELQRAAARVLKWRVVTHPVGDLVHREIVQVEPVRLVRSEGRCGGEVFRVIRLRILPLVDLFSIQYCEHVLKLLPQAFDDLADGRVIQVGLV